MVHYVQTHDVQKKGVIAYYILLCFLGMVVFLSPTGSMIPITTFTSDRSNCPSSPDMGGGNVDNCGNAPCHPNEYNAWLGTGHATNVVELNATHVRIGAYTEVSYIVFDAECAMCHTSGYNDITGNYDDLGVNCIACHDGSWSVWSDYSGDHCGTCHSPSGSSGPHQYLVWLNSAHANSLTDLRASDHATASCMGCHSTEGFIHMQNPGTLSDTNPDVNTTFDPTGDYNAISCPACHSVHANWSSSSPSMIRAPDTESLCLTCHSGGPHSMYDLWVGSTHEVLGVQCVDCHGYSLRYNETGQNWVPFLNHSFSVNATAACGQSDFCHSDSLAWALGQLETTDDLVDSLVAEVLQEVALLQTQLDIYNNTSSPDPDVVSFLQESIFNATSIAQAYQDGSAHLFQDRMNIVSDLNNALRTVVEARSVCYEELHEIQSPGTITFIIQETERVTETVTVLLTPPPGNPNLLFSAGSVIGISAGLVLGFILGKKVLFK